MYSPEDNLVNLNTYISRGILEQKKNVAQLENTLNTWHGSCHLIFIKFWNVMNIFTFYKGKTGAQHGHQQVSLPYHRLSIFMTWKLASARTFDLSEAKQEPHDLYNPMRLLEAGKAAQPIRCLLQKNHEDLILEPQQPCKKESPVAQVSTPSSQAYRDRKNPEPHWPDSLANQ